MATEFRPHWGSNAAATITLTSLAAGAGRISTQIANTNQGSAGAEGDEAELLRIWWKITTGGVAPVVGAPYILYLIRSDAGSTEHIGEGLGTADAAVTTQPNNSDMLHSIPAIAATAKAHYGEAVITNPGPKFSFLAWNGTLQSISSTASDHYVRYALGAMRQVTV